MDGNAKRWLATAVKAGAAAGDLVRRPRAGVVVLLYHRVGGGTGTSVDQPPELFDAQVGELAHRVITIDDALTRLARPEPDDASERPVVITFDDGTADFTEKALPILERHRVPVTLYAATQFLDEGRAFDDGSPPLSWSALRDARATGLVTVGSHTHTHRLLDRVGTDDAAAELDRSVARIEDELGAGVDHFAYPKALLGSTAAETEVRRRFRSAALAGTAVNEFGVTDPHRLARSPVQVGDGMRWFRRKAEGGMQLEDTLRRGLNRRRYAAATT